MGHRLSKITVNSCNATKLEQQQQQDAEQEQQHNKNQTHHAAPSLMHTSCTSAAESNIPTINLQIQETPNDNNNVQIHSVREAENSSSTCSRQIIIKIQLAKMENDVQQLVSTSDCCNEHYSSSNSGSSTLSRSANNNGAQFLNLTFNRNTTQGEIPAAHGTTTADTSRLQQQQQHSSKQVTDKVMDERTAGSSPSFVVNNNFSQNVVVTSTTASCRQDNFNILMGPMSDLQLDEKRMSVASVVSSASSSGEFVQSNADDCQAEQQSTALALASSSCAEENADDYCCRRKSKSNTFPSKWRCYKCTCRDAFKRIMDASSSKSSKKKEQRSEKTNSPKNQQHSSEQQPLWTPLQTNSPRSNGLPLTSNGQQSAAAPPHMSIWSPSTNDVIIPISSPQFVVVQCPPSSLVTLGRIDDNAIRLMATELVAANSNNAQRLLNTPAELSATPANSSTTTTSSSMATPNRGGGVGGGICPTTTAVSVAAGPVVHSQVDYIHCLVPDLERITKASFYWGKMDRYEAERLLEGKPEGTFLLRDSAQEEYLFSVTFRKYGRSLHARIEQSNHKFSFDCHDPCVFTASTVTGLLEHYKDPACVMFFEPMLTIPLHRNTTFSLQQLCRATIVSNTSYDGINELELPSRLKSYLKEYHYKQKLRVKPFDEPFYSCT